MVEFAATKELVPNAAQKKSFGKTPHVVVQAHSEADLPNELTALGEKKVKFLVQGIAQVKTGDKVLELFGGTNASTSVIEKVAKPAMLISVDLHNSISSKAPWRYDAIENYRRRTVRKGGKPPYFVTADAKQLPFADKIFTKVIAPDSPRNSAERLEATKAAGAESMLSLEDQQVLFRESSLESFRVLKDGGVFAGTAPLSWAVHFASAGFGQIQLFSHADLPGVTRLSIGRELQFKTAGVSDPVIYFKCVKI